MVLSLEVPAAKPSAQRQVVIPAAAAEADDEDAKNLALAMVMSLQNVIKDEIKLTGNSALSPKP